MKSTIHKLYQDGDRAGYILDATEDTIKYIKQMDVIRHYLAPYDQETKTQKCMMCGEIIHDYNGAMYKPNSDGSPIIENGWHEGEHYVSVGNPQHFSTAKPFGKNINVKLCKLNYNNK